MPDGPQSGSRRHAPLRPNWLRVRRNGPPGPGASIEANQPTGILCGAYGPSAKWDRMAGQRVTVQVQGCVQANEAEIRQAVENALANLMALVEMDDIEFSSPEEIAQVAEQMIRASMDRMGIEDVVGLTATCVGAD